MRRTAARLPKEPFLEGVVITRVGAKALARTRLKGACILDESQSYQVQKLFVDSARFTGREPPKKFKLQAGEIFYEGRKIAEVRLAGTLPRVRRKGKGRLQRWWRVGEDPGFDLTLDFGLKLSPSDRGRSYVAALRLGGPLILSWDVTANTTAYSSGAMSDVRIIRIAMPDSAPKAAGVKDKARIDLAIFYTELIIEAADEMKKLLIRLRDGAGVDTAAQHRAFRHAFAPLLKQRTGGGADGRLEQGRLSIKRLGQWDLKRELLNAVLGAAKESLSIRRGRRSGSKTKKRATDVETRDLIRRKKILHAMTAEYKKFRRNLEVADAEAKVTKVAVAKRLKKVRGTLDNWLEEGGWDFDKLRNEVIECSETK